MKNKLKYTVFIFCLLLIFTACKSSGRINHSSINDNLKAPKLKELPFEGVWEISDIKSAGNKDDGKNEYKIGDQLLIDPEMVALSNNITLLPNFSSKYVNAKDYRDMRFINQIPGIEDDSFLFVCMIRDNDVFSMDLFRISDERIAFYKDGNLYILEQKNELVPQIAKDRYLEVAKEQKVAEQGKASSSYLATLIGVREPRRSNEGYPYYDYSTYLICDLPDQNRPLLYKIDKLFLPSDDKHINILEYKALEGDDNNLIMRGQYSFYSTEDKEKSKVQILRDNYGRNISYAHDNIVSFDMPAKYPPDNRSRKKYELHFLDQLSADHPLDVVEIGGKTEKEAMLNQIVAQRNFLNLDEKALDENSVDYSNIGIERRNTDWTFVSSINWKQANKDYPSKINLDLVPSIPFFDLSLEKATWSRVTNKQPLAETASKSPASERMLIKTEDEILYYKLYNENISDEAIFSIQLEGAGNIVSLEYFYDDKAKNIKDVFLQEDQAQPHFIYSDRQN